MFEPLKVYCICHSVMCFSFSKQSQYLETSYKMDLNLWVIVVVVAYVDGEQLWSCRDGQLT